MTVESHNTSEYLDGTEENGGQLILVKSDARYEFRCEFVNNCYENATSGKPERVELFGFK